MSIQKNKPEQIVTALRQIEVQIANGKTVPQAVRRQIMLDTEHKKIRWRSGSSGLMLGCPSFEVQPFS